MASAVRFRTSASTDDIRPMAIVTACYHTGCGRGLGREGEVQAMWELRS